ncbi:MAG: M56 family metallopeptidase [Limisphaerales bacterium]
MTSASLAIAWLQLLALLAAEVGLIALGVALLRRCSLAAAWQRTFCQAGIMAVLVVTVGELSGSARALGGWAVSVLAWQKGDNLPRRTEVPLLAPLTPVNLKPALRPESQAPAVEQTPRFADEEAFAPPPSTPFTQALPRNAAATASRPPDSVSDSMAVLWLCLVWVAGGALAAARACLAQCLFMIFQLRRRPVTERALAEKVQALAWTLGIRRRVRVIESARLTSPIAFGLIRPTVGLPPDFAMRFDPAKQDAMLAHELAHLAVHDPFWCLLADVATVVLWWHPGVWWLRRQLHLASEMAADEASLLVANGPRLLAECLVELGARLTGLVLLGELRVSGFRSHLGRRVQRLMHVEGRAWSPPPRLGAALTRIFGPMAMTVIVVLCTAWAAPQALTTGNSMKMMQLNWKRSLATFALLAAFNGPEASVAVAQSDKPAPPPTPAPEVAPAPPALPADPSANSEATEASAAPKPPSPPAGAATDTKDARALEAFRARYGLHVPRRPPHQAEKPAHGSKTEAKLKQIVLPEIGFDGLPLGEVLKILSDEALKRDPDKTGVNFLINPNIPSVARMGAVDPFTGLPPAAPAEQLDLASVNVKFNLPLCNVTMKDVLDAIVVVADHPIEYSLEDYAVVFSAKSQGVASNPDNSARPDLVPELPQPLRPTPNPFRPRPDFVPMAPEQPSPPDNKPATPREPFESTGEPVEVKPQAFNIDFGSASPSEQVGPAAAGRAGDFWNTVAVPFNDHHTESDLKFVGGEPSPIEVEMINLGGCYGSRGVMGVKSPMLDTCNYPTGNRGGDSTVILRQVPPGKYAVYIYGHGTVPLYYGDYTLTVGTRNYGQKQTSHKMDAIENTKWVEGSQYVKFTNVKVGEEEDMEVLIRPGAEVTEPSGRSFADAMICGLQLIPENPLGSPATAYQVPLGHPVAVPAPPGLVSWWRSEGNGLDQVGGNNGVLLNGVGFDPGAVGQAFRFNGTDSYVEVPDSPALRLTNQLTIEFWVKRQDLEKEDYIINKGGDYTRGALNYGVTITQPQWGGALAFTFAGGARHSLGITDLNWHHCAVTARDGDVDPSFYVDGVQQPVTLRQGASTISLYASTAALDIGAQVDPASGWLYYSEALVDELSIYNRVLALPEIQAIYNAGSAGKRLPAR